MIGIAGPPGAGKSTLAEALCARLNEHLPDDPASVVPMDGYHFDDDDPQGAWGCCRAKARRRHSMWRASTICS
jgi:Ni2+-binding GTPase involved in maturation of urease and hydrogenase